MSEEFQDESCYIDVAHGDGLVVVYEERFNFVRGYPVSQIIDLIEEGVENKKLDELKSEYSSLSKELKEGRVKLNSIMKEIKVEMQKEIEEV